MRRVIKCNRGITLVELVITIALLGILTGMTTVILVSTQRSSAQNEAIANAQTQADSVRLLVSQKITDFDLSGATLQVDENAALLLTNGDSSCVVSFSENTLTVDGESQVYPYITNVTFRLENSNTLRLTVAYSAGGKQTERFFLFTPHAAVITQGV